MTSQAQQLFDAAFARVRDPRSEAYRAGVLALLRWKESRVPLERPYLLGTAEADAWFSGVDEGNSIWRTHTGRATLAAELDGKR